ncbi:MAG: hypothetical protein Q4C83_03085, partial [Candidatus Saccharibacteria bacterium]|nr:hypothetical protein [Candidatus Saccharibacteria bacterium]
AKTASNWPDQEKTAIANLTDGTATLYALTKENNDAGLNPTVKQLGYASSIGKQWFVNGNSASAISTASIAIMRSPLDGSLLVASGVSTQTDASGRVKLNFNSARTNMTSSQRLAVAIVNGNLGYKGGLLCIPGGDSSAGISNNFNADLKWDNLSDVSNSNKVAEECRNWE